MTMFQATICGGPHHGRVTRLNERRRWIVETDKADGRQMYRLIAQAGEELLYVHEHQRLPVLAKAVRRDEPAEAEAARRAFGVEAARVLRLPRPWKWAVASEPFGDDRVLVRSRLTVGDVTAEVG